MGRKEKFFRAYYIQDIHWGTHFIYIQNIHQNYTHFTFAPLLASTSIIIPFRNYISNTHQTSIRLAPFTYLSTRPFAHSPIAPHKITPILFTFRNYISIRIRITFIPHLHPCLHLHSQAFYHIIITFRTYIRITFLFHRVTYFAFAFLFTL